jgi:hypothetical protein
MIMLAHGFSIDLMVELINAGLATAKAERMVASGKSIKATRVRITEAGRVALAEAGRAKKSSSPLIHRSGAFIGEEAGDRGFS